MAEGSVTNNVLIGKGGWLFLWQGAQRQFDFLMGKLTVNPQSVENFVKNIEGRRKICEDHGVPYLHIAFPSKPVVMTEFLPAEMEGKVGSFFEAQYAEAAAKRGVASILYPRATLIEENAARPVFRWRDTHLNETGSVIIVREILKRLGHHHDPFAHLVAEPRPRLGDLAKMSGTRDRDTEDFWVVKNKLAKLWDNREFLPGNTGNIAIIRNRGASSDQRLLAIGDSFLKDCLTGLATFYRDILYVRSDVFQPDLLHLFSPDAVITSNAERYLSNVRPDHDAESMIMSLYGQEGYQPSAAFTDALKAQLAYRAYPSRYHAWAEQADVT